MKRDNNFRQHAALGVVAAAPVVAVTAWTLATGWGSRSLLADAGGQLTSVGPVQVSVVATVTAAAGMFVLAGLVRRLRRGLLVWGVTACITLVISFAGALGGVTLHDRAALMALHAVTGIVVIAGGVLATRPDGRTSAAQPHPRVEAGTRGR